MNKLFLVQLLLLFCVVSIFVGVNKISFLNLFDVHSTEWKILVTTRIPRTISLLLAGATLSLLGLLMQQLTQNKFTSPSTVGTTQSARLGLILSVFFFPQASVIHRAGFAFVFAILGTITFIGLLNRIQARNSIVVPIVGIVFGNVLSSFGTYLALQWDIIQNLSAWLQGNFSLIHSENFQLLLFALFAMVGILLGAHYFSVIGLGKDLAVQLGIAYKKVMAIGIFLIAIGSAAVLLTVGNIPFLGIVIPNLISLTKGDYFKDNIFFVAIYGALFLLICDILARLILYPCEISVSVIVGILGSIFFIYLLFVGELL